MKDIQPRQLTKQFDNGNLGVVFTGTNTFNISVEGGDWEDIPQTLTTTACIAARDYIDLSGYTQEELTTFIQSVAIQQQGAPLLSTVSTASIPLVWVYDFITTRKISNEELDAMGTTVPGFSPSTVDLMQVIYGQSRLYATNGQVPGTYITVDSDTFGSGNPSAADKLHWTRVMYVVPIGINEQFAAVGVMPANLVCQAVTGKEKDLVYIERLRRSYVVQGEL